MDGDRRRCKCCRPLVFVFIFVDPSQRDQALQLVRDLMGQADGGDADMDMETETELGG